MDAAGLGANGGAWVAAGVSVGAAVSTAGLTPALSREEAHIAHTAHRIMHALHPVAAAPSSSQSMLEQVRAAAAAASAVSASGVTHTVALPTPPPRPLPPHQPAPAPTPTPNHHEEDEAEYESESEEEAEPAGEPASDIAESAPPSPAIAAPAGAYAYGYQSTIPLPLTDAGSGSRRLSKRVDIKVQAKAAQPTVRWAPAFEPPSLDDISALFAPSQPAPAPHADQQDDTPVKQEAPDCMGTSTDGVATAWIADDMVKGEVKIEGTTLITATDAPPPPLPDLFPDLALPTHLFLLKSRLPASTRRMLHSRRYRKKKKAQQLLQLAPVALGADGLPVPAPPAAKKASAKKRTSRKKRVRNEWSDSEGDDNQSVHSTASERMLDLVYHNDFDAAEARARKVSSVKRKQDSAAASAVAAASTVGSTASAAAVPSASPPVRSAHEQHLYDLANFGVESDDDFVNVNGQLDGGDDAYDDEDMQIESEDEEFDDEVVAIGGRTQAERKIARRDDEFERIKFQASMELTERRAYDKLVQNEINDSYAFCDSSPRTMVLSRDSILIKLDLSDILNNGILSFFSEQQIETLKGLLPECDRTASGLSSTFITPVFLQSMYEYQELLMTGSLDPDMREMRNVVSARRRRESQDTWKAKNFERYWGEQYSNRYSRSEDKGSKTKGPSTVYWKPKAMKADLHDRQGTEALLLRCMANDVFALRRRKALLIKDKRWPLPTLAELKVQHASGVAASMPPASAASAAASPSEPRAKSKSKKEKADQPAPAPVPAAGPALVALSEESMHNDLFASIAAKQSRQQQPSKKRNKGDGGEPRPSKPRAPREARDGDQPPKKRHNSGKKSEKEDTPVFDSNPPALVAAPASHHQQQLAEEPAHQANGQQVAPEAVAVVAIQPEYQMAYQQQMAYPMPAVPPAYAAYSPFNAAYAMQQQYAAYHLYQQQQLQFQQAYPGYPVQAPPPAAGTRQHHQQRATQQQPQQAAQQHMQHQAFIQHQQMLALMQQQQQQHQQQQQQAALAPAPTAAELYKAKMDMTAAAAAAAATIGAKSSLQHQQLQTPGRAPVNAPAVAAAAANASAASMAAQIAAFAKMEATFTALK